MEMCLVFSIRLMYCLKITAVVLISILWQLLCYSLFFKGVRKNYWNKLL